MSDRENVGSQVDAIQFGIMLGKMDELIKRFDRLDSEIKSNYATKETTEALEQRIQVLETAPKHKRAEIIAFFACLFAGGSGIGTVVSLFLKH